MLNEVRVWHIASVICFLLTNKIKQDEKSKSRNTTRTKRNID
jgi:hypothetical protein